MNDRPTPDTAPQARIAYDLIQRAHDHLTTHHGVGCVIRSRQVSALAYAVAGVLAEHGERLEAIEALVKGDDK